MIRRLVHTWRTVKADPEQGELLSREWFIGGDQTLTRQYSRHWVEHSWWLDPNRFAVGISFDRVDWLPGGYDGRTGITLHLGPLLFVIDLCQPIRPLLGQRVSR